MVFECILLRVINNFSKYKFNLIHPTECNIIFPELVIVYDLFNENRELIPITNSNWYVLDICLLLLNQKLSNFMKIKDNISDENKFKMVLEIRLFYNLELFKLLNIRKKLLMNYVVFSLKIYNELKYVDLYEMRESIRMMMFRFFSDKIFK